MSDEWPSLLAPADKIVPIIAFERRFKVELPPKSFWLCQQTLEILPSDGVSFYKDGSLCEGRVGAGVFLETLDIREFYAQRYMQFSPVLTTIGARRCTT
jgi:hypothetical protein